MRPLFWFFVVGFNLVGMVDIIVDYYHGVTLGLADVAGQLGATYVIPIIYVPILMITHVAALVLIARAARSGAAADRAEVRPANLG
jgi:uncharacterized membrane protein